MLLAAALLGVARQPSGEELAQDRGAAGTWQALQKLTTAASLMHTTAHPDDEHGGLLALMSRGMGVRTTLLTLNRGEAGDNAIGSELFDGLGLIRAEELRVAGRYYGLDRQYFTTVADYGFSKRLDEAIEQWGRERVLRDMVRAIRLERPLVIVSRWQGSERDGHGQHQAAGLLSREAFEAAGDPTRFPEQIEEGLRPWQALKLYMGGAREDEPWHVRIDPGRFDPVLGDSYQNLARRGLSLQRSQTSGRFVESTGPAPLFYVRLASRVAAPDRENGFFDGIDTTLYGLPRALGWPGAADAAPLLERIGREAAAAKEAFTFTAPSRAAPALARGLAAVREALKRFGKDPELRHVLLIKEEQFVDALTRALGVHASAVAVPAGTPDPSGPYAQFAPAPVMDPVVPGSAIDVRTSLAALGGAPVTLEALTIRAQGREAPAPAGEPEEIGASPVNRTVRVTLPEDIEPTRPHLSRESIAVNHYTAAKGVEPTLPSPPPPIVMEARLAFDGVPFTVRRPVIRRESQLPYGYAERELVIVPALSVAVSPRQAMVPVGSTGRTVDVTVTLTNNRSEAVRGEVGLDVPAGWRVEPAKAPFEVAGDGASTRVALQVQAGSTSPGSYPLRVVATVDGRTYSEGYEVIAHRDLETRYRYRPAVVNVAAIDVKIAPGLKVGYVMGVGDEIPAAIEQLGASVELLDATALASSPLERFDAIVLGTRAYAVRADLRANNARLLDYARNGGNLIVLYNTPEFDPRTQAPYPATLPRNAEEVAEQDVPVKILQPDHPVFTAPNRIGPEDFAGWIEQRGSKFWSEWDPAYTPLLECHDRGQAPQRGGWLHARVGKGHYSYVAFAFHRQLPYGVPGAYRLFANLLSLGSR